MIIHKNRSSRNCVVGTKFNGQSTEPPALKGFAKTSSIPQKASSNFIDSKLLCKQEKNKTTTNTLGSAEH